jgi:hypothetical protein
MQINLRIDQREFDLNTGESLYLRINRLTLHIVRDPGGPFWPHVERVGRNEGLWLGFGLQLAYSLAPEAPRVRR